MRTTITCVLGVLLLFTVSCSRSEPSAPPPTPSSPAAPASPAPAARTLVIEKVVVDETPQSGTWLMCFMANAEGGSSATFNVPNRTYSGDGITIDMNLEIPNVTDGQRISFRKFLDDDQADVCGNAAEDKSNGEFRVSSSGSQHYSFDNWEYTVFWRTK